MDLFSHNRLLELRELIKKYNHYYYDLSDPIVSDFEYDTLYKELESLESQELGIDKGISPLKKIGGEVDQRFKKIKHKIPMISLSNSYNKEDIYAWNEKLKRFLLDFLKKEKDPKIYSEVLSLYENYKKNFFQKHNEFLNFSGNLSIEEFLLKKLEYVLEPKIDGVSISVTYVDGKINKAVSRGDGIFGEDITKNLLTSSDIPINLKSEKFYIPKVLEVRGEAYIDKETLKNLNKNNKENNENLFSNSRNAVSGTLKLLNVNLVKERNIKIFFYALGYFEEDEKKSFSDVINTQEKFLIFLKDLGFKVNNYIVKYQNIDDTVKNAINFVEKREALPYDIDGMVIKVNSFFEQKILGNTIKFPRWAISYKFPAKQMTTILKDIAIQVGRTGVLTPVAILEPCNISGVIIKKATLHNFDEIKRLNIKIGSRVLLERSADVIPKIIKVMPDENCVLKDFSIPKNCPVCGVKIIKNLDEVAYRCPNNISCKAHLAKSIEFFVSKKGMNIDGLGEKVIEELIDKGFLSNIFDIFNLKKENFLTLPLFKDKKADNLIKHIEKSKKVELKNFIYSLGIRHIGERSSKILAQEYKTFFDISKATIEDLEKIENFGNILAESIKKFFVENPDIFEKIEKSKIIIQNSEFLENLEFFDEDLENIDKEKKSWFGYNKNFVITGKFDISRDKIINFIEKKGGKVLKAVSKNVDFLILGKNDEESSKYKKALDLGIAIIDDLEKIYA